MNNNGKVFYDLNKRALEFRNSKEYFVGDRIVRYLKLLKGLHFIRFFKQLGEDFFRVVFKKKTNPPVQELDFSTPYRGEKIAVYTAIYGNYDSIPEPLYADPKCDYYIFTDQEIPDSSIWKKLDYTFSKEINTNFLKNRYLKMMPHKVFKDHRYSLYIDGNLILTSDVSLYMNHFSSSCGIGMHRHPSNKSIYEEVKYNVRLKKITKQEAKQILKQYHQDQMPDHYGMTECNAILRDHENAECVKIMESWWEHICSGVKRDQLYFTYVLFKCGHKVDDLYILGNNINSNPMFIRERHI